MVTYNTLSDKPEAQYSLALNDDTPYSCVYLQTLVASFLF